MPNRSITSHIHKYLLKKIRILKVSAAQRKIDPGYDVAALGRDLDFIGIMTYDLHGAWDRITGFNSPLYARYW